MVVFRIPCSLREHTASLEAVSVPSDDVLAGLRELARRFPACGQRVLDGAGQPRRWVRFLPDGATVRILPAG